MRRIVYILLAILMIAMIGCKKENTEAAKSTPAPAPQSALTPKPESAPAQQTEPTEAIADPSYTFIEIPAIEQKSMSVDDQGTPNKAEMEAMTVTSVDGSITETDQQNSHSFTAPYDGTYHLLFNMNRTKTALHVNVLSENGKEIFVAVTGYSSDSSIEYALTNLKAGENYTVLVSESGQPVEYTLRIGMQKQETDISALTELADSMEFSKQRNVYVFVPPLDGNYCFEAAHMENGMSIKLLFVNEQNETVKTRSTVQNSDCLTLTDLKAGKTYRLIAEQKKEYGSYSILIHRQREAVNVSDCTAVADSFAFEDEANVYTFTAPRDGLYRFELSGMKTDAVADLAVLDLRNNEIAHGTLLHNGGGVVLKDAAAGEQYQIRVTERDAVGNYKLLIWPQKETVTVGRNMIVHDVLEYKEQQNRYSFTTEKDGDVTVRINNNKTSFVNIYVYNEYNERLDGKIMGNSNKGLTVSGLKAGQHITIVVGYRDGLGSYELQID